MVNQTKDFVLSRRKLMEQLTNSLTIDRIYGLIYHTNQDVKTDELRQS